MRSIRRQEDESRNQDGETKKQLRDEAEKNRRLAEGEEQERSPTGNQQRSNRRADGMGDHPRVNGPSGNRTRWSVLESRRGGGERRGKKKKKKGDQHRRVKRGIGVFAETETCKERHLLDYREKCWGGIRGGGGSASV